MIFGESSLVENRVPRRQSFSEFVNNLCIVKLVCGGVFCRREDRSSQEFKNLLEAAVGEGEISIKTGLLGEVLSNITGSVSLVYLARTDLHTRRRSPFEPRLRVAGPNSAILW